MSLRHFLVLLFLSLTILSYAQEGQVNLNLKNGNNVALGYYAALSVEAHHCFQEGFSITGGAQYNNKGHFMTEARPAYFHKFVAGVMHVETLLHYILKSNIHNYAFGAGIGFTARYVYLKLGYYYRAFAIGSSIISEPFNIYYEFGVSCLPRLPKWDLKVSISNSRIFELERHYQPSLFVDAWWYPSKRTGVTLGVSYKTAGMFNMSCDYDQFYINTGIHYKW